MEENIPIENESRKKFEKTVKGIKKMLKSGKVNPVESVEAMVEANEKTKKKDMTSTVTKDRGVVYIGHIPHGFYEEQMKPYFSQFGKVTNVRVARSPKTGRSKGYAFVEFQNKEVAQIVAETMNNYLMDKRLLKAEYIPPEKQRPKFFEGRKWVPGKYFPAMIKRKKEIFRKNKHVTNEEWLQEAKKRIKRLHKLKQTLRSAGIDYDFFQPVDIPKELEDYDPANPDKHVIKTKPKEKKTEKSDNNKEKKIDESQQKKGKMGKKSAKSVENKENKVENVKQNKEVKGKKVEKSELSKKKNVELLQQNKKEKNVEKNKQKKNKKDNDDEVPQIKKNKVPAIVEKKDKKNVSNKKQPELSEKDIEKIGKAIKQQNKGSVQKKMSNKDEDVKTQKLLALKSKTIDKKTQKKNFSKVSKKSMRVK